MKYHIKARKQGERRWSFVAGNGRSHLRVYALEYRPEYVDEALKVLAEDNPGFEFKKQPVEVRTKPTPAG